MTLRQLVWMADGRRIELWNQTAQLAALIANVNRDPKKQPEPFSPSDWHPYFVKPKRDPIKAPITALKVLIPGGLKS